MASKRKEIEELIYGCFDKLDPSGTNTKKYREKFSKMNESQFNSFLKELSDDKDRQFYLEIMPLKNEPDTYDIQNAAEFLGLPLEQHIQVRHDTETPYWTRYKMPVGYMNVRRLQQLLQKKVGYSIDLKARNALTGQLSSHSAVGRVADEEVYAMKAFGADNTLKEFFGPRSDNRAKRIPFYQQLGLEGYARLSDLPTDVRTQGTLNYLDVLFTAAGLQTNLVSKNELKLNRKKTEE